MSDRKISGSAKAKGDVPKASDVLVHCAFTDIVDVATLVPNPHNPNTHPPRQIDVLSRVIVAQGWRAPITVSKRSGFIVRGHGRLKAAIKAGLTEVPVDYQDYADESAEWADLVADNRIAELSEIDMDLLKKGMAEFDMDQFDMTLTGYDIGELSRLLDEEFPIVNNAAEEWKGMPDFENEDNKAYRSLIVHFLEEEHCEAFQQLVGQTLTDKTKYIWFPEMERNKVADLRVMSTPDGAAEAETRG